MSDTRFKWLTSVIAITIIAMTGIICFSLIPPPEKAAKTKEYVYLDDYGIVHTDRKCSRLNYKGMTSERIKIENFNSANYLDFCPKCVDDKTYESLISNFCEKTQPLI